MTNVAASRTHPVMTLSPDSAPPFRIMYALGCRHRQKERDKDKYDTEAETHTQTQTQKQTQTQRDRDRHPKAYLNPNP